MDYINRKITQPIKETLQRGKSILLLGARQTGKTTMLEHSIQPDITYTFVDPEIRLRYEKTPTLLAQELKLKLKDLKQTPLIFIDEIQKVPLVMDVAQLFIDKKKAQFILSGSSARKLKHGASINLLPGRVSVMTMDPLHVDELPHPLSITDILTYGTLPHIVTEPNLTYKEDDLRSYVTTYLEEEIRAEALVRNVGHFARFLELAASESGQIINFTKLSQDVGVAASTITEYYQILEDCMVAFRIDPITHSTTHRRLIKSPKYLFFDLGIRRVCAHEGTQLAENYFGKLFEQYIGIELIHLTRSHPELQVKYWRDSGGIEVDYVVESNRQYIPIEVKWSTQPDIKDARHLQKFLADYPNTQMAYIVCRTPQAFEIAENIIALPWQELSNIKKRTIITLK